MGHTLVFLEKQQVRGLEECIDWVPRLIGRLVALHCTSAPFSCADLHGQVLVD